MEYKEIFEKSLVMDNVAGDFKLEVYYTTKSQYEINVTRISTGDVKTTVISSLHEPLFGIDVSDYEEILARAEALCYEFEQEVENEKG